MQLFTVHSSQNLAVCVHFTPTCETRGGVTHLILCKLEKRHFVICKIRLKCFAFGACFQNQFFLLARGCFVVPFASETKIPHHKHELNFPILLQERWVVLLCCIFS